MEGVVILHKTCLLSKHPVVMSTNFQEFPQIERNQLDIMLKYNDSDGFYTDWKPIKVVYTSFSDVSRICLKSLKIPIVIYDVAAINYKKKMLNLSVLISVCDVLHSSSLVSIYKTRL